MLPLWLGVVPFGLAYAVTARAGGLSILETQALSVFVFAGGELPAEFLQKIGVRFRTEQMLVPA